MVGAGRVNQRRGAVENQHELYPGRALEQQSHGVAGHVAVRSAGQLDAKRFAAQVDPQLLHDDLREGHHAGGCHPILFVVDPHLLARHDPGAEQIAAPPRQLGDLLDHDVMHVFVRAEFDHLVLAIIVDDGRVSGHPVPGHKDVEEGAGDPVLQLVETDGLDGLVVGGILSSPQVGGVEQHHHFGAALIDVLVLGMLGMGQDKIFPEQGVGVGDQIVLAAGNDRAPATAGDIGKADMVAEAGPAEEEGDAKRQRRRQVGGKFRPQFAEIGGIETKGEGLLFKDKGIGFQGMANHQQAAAEDVAADFVEMAATGIVVGHGRGRRGQRRLVVGFTHCPLRLEAAAKQFHQLQGDLRVGMERGPHLFKIVAVRLAVRQGGMTERDEGVDQGSLGTAHHAGDDELAVRLRTGGKDLGGPQFFAQLPE